MYFLEVYTVSDASMIFVTLVTIERYIAICKPVYHRLINTKRRCYKLVSASWVIATLLTIPSIPQIARVFTLCFVWPRDDAFFNDFPIVTSYCNLVYDFAISTIFYLVTPIPFGVALVSSIFCYTSIIIQHRSALNKPATDNPEP